MRHRMYTKHREGTRLRMGFRLKPTFLAGYTNCKVFILLGQQSRGFPPSRNAPPTLASVTRRPYELAQIGFLPHIVRAARNPMQGRTYAEYYIAVCIVARRMSEQRSLRRPVIYKGQRVARDTSSAFSRFRSLIPVTILAP